MKYKITVNDKTYQVEIEDINARPVIARVDGVRFEVMPEHGGNAELSKPAEPRENQIEVKPVFMQAAHPALSSDTLTAPLPGTVTEVFIKPGEQVEAGQVVLIIEAMKMKNSIRSTHTGTVQDVMVSAGQSVAHKQALVKFAE